MPPASPRPQGPARLRVPAMLRAVPNQANAQEASQHVQAQGADRCRRLRSPCGPERRQPAAVATSAHKESRVRSCRRHPAAGAGPARWLTAGSAVRRRDCSRGGRSAEHGAAGRRRSLPQPDFRRCLFWTAAARAQTRGEQADKHARWNRCLTAAAALSTSLLISRHWPVASAMFCPRGFQVDLAVFQAYAISRAAGRGGASALAPVTPAKRKQM